MTMKKRKRKKKRKMKMKKKKGEEEEQQELQRRDLQPHHAAPTPTRRITIARATMALRIGR